MRSWEAMLSIAHCLISVWVLTLGDLTMLLTMDLVSPFMKYLMVVGAVSGYSAFWATLSKSWMYWLMSGHFIFMPSIWRHAHSSACESWNCFWNSSRKFVQTLGTSSMSGSSRSTQSPWLRAHSSTVGPLINVRAIATQRIQDWRPGTVVFTWK
jgi:hypothetical protein